MSEQERCGQCGRTTRFDPTCNGCVIWNLRQQLEAERTRADEAERALAEEKSRVGWRDCELVISDDEIERLEQRAEAAERLAAERAGMVDRLRANLEFYAEKRNYNRAGGDPPEAMTFIEADYGQRARSAIAAAAGPGAAEPISGGGE